MSKDIIGDDVGRRVQGPNFPKSICKPRDKREKHY